MNLNSIWSALEESYNRFNGISFEGSLNAIAELNLPSDWFIWLVAVMRFEHTQITDLLGNIESATDLDSARALARQMIQVTRGHFQKEEQILFRMARQFLGEDELSALGAQWAQKRAPLIIL